MSNLYVRKTGGNKRGFKKIFDYARANKSARKAANLFEIPRKTLDFRIKNGYLEGPTKMGPSSIFGKENKIRLDKHINTMKQQGFPMAREDVRELAYNFTEI